MTTVTVVSESGLIGGHDRLLVAPAHGRLVVPAPASFTADGEVVREGDVIATIDGDGKAVEVKAPCDAWIMDFLVRDGQRVEPGTAIAHLRVL
jgi:biotin carboxyl carrier protein